MGLVWYHKLYDIQHISTEKTYLMCDNTVLMTRVNATRKGECYKLEMIISETDIKDNTWRPWRFDVDR
jgi:hypothetical protein